VLSHLSIPSFLVAAFHRSEVNSVSLSLMISRGRSCSLEVSFRKKLANCCVSRSFEQSMKWLIFLADR